MAGASDKETLLFPRHTRMDKGLACAEEIPRDLRSLTEFRKLLGAVCAVAATAWGWKAKQGRGEKRGWRSGVGRGLGRRTPAYPAKTFGLICYGQRVTSEGGLGGRHGWSLGNTVRDLMRMDCVGSSK